MKLLKVAVLVGAVALFMSPSLKAGPVTIDFGTCAQVTSGATFTGGVCAENSTNAPNSITYQTAGGANLVASGFLAAGGTEGLYIKNTSGNQAETGLGTQIDALDHEITGKDFVTMDVTDLLAHGITEGIFRLGSIQSGEGYTVCVGSSTAGTLGGSCSTATPGTLEADVAVSWGLLSGPIFVQIEGVGVDATTGAALSGDVIAESFTQTPEPATLTLLGIGMFGLAGARRKAAKK
jgi:hypothetical protein